MDIISILTAAVGLGASDIHLAAGSPPLCRLGGEVAELPGFPELSGDLCKALIYSILAEDQRAAFEADCDLDCSVQIGGLSRFRVNVLMQHSGVEAVIRVIAPDIPSPEYLGLGPAVMSLASLPRGLVLVTGSTGSGKSTTLACMIEHINQNFKKHIVTIEDPIEFLYKRKRSLIRQREVGPHTKSFGAALRHAMRQDPDVIMVGELRDLETIALALTAAETGHLCFATLHTADATQSIDRIIDVFPHEQQQQVRVQLAQCLKAVVSQSLLPLAAGNGRVAARELLIVNAAVSTLIRDSKTHMIPSVIETGGKSGMHTLDKSLEDLVRRGLVRVEDAAACAHHPAKFHGAMAHRAVAAPVLA